MNPASRVNLVETSRRARSSSAGAGQGTATGRAPSAPRDIARHPGIGRRDDRVEHAVHAFAQQQGVHPGGRRQRVRGGLEAQDAPQERLPRARGHVLHRRDGHLAPPRVGALARSPDEPEVGAQDGGASPTVGRAAVGVELVEHRNPRRRQRATVAPGCLGERHLQHAAETRAGPVQPRDHGVLVGRPRFVRHRREHRTHQRGLLRAVRQPQALDERRGRASLAVVVARLPRQRHLPCGGQQLGEQVALLVEAEALDRNLREDVALHRLAEPVREERVLAHLTGEGVPVEAEQKEVVEGSRPRLDHREHLHASPGPAERRRTRTLESPPHQHEELLAGQRQLLRQLVDEGREHLADRLGTGGVGTPAQPRVEEAAEAPQVLRRARLCRPRLQDRHEGRGPPHGAAKPGARQAAVRCDPPAAALVALLLRRLDEPAPHRQRQRAVLVQQRTHLERGDVAHACGPAAVQGQANVEPSEIGGGGEPAVGRRLCAPPQQLRERSRAPCRCVDRGEAPKRGERDPEAREVHPDRKRVRPEVARDDSDSLGGQYRDPAACVCAARPPAPRRVPPGRGT